MLIGSKDLEESIEFVNRLSDEEKERIRKDGRNLPADVGRELILLFEHIEKERDFHKSLGAIGSPYSQPLLKASVYNLRTAIAYCVLRQENQDYEINSGTVVVG